MGMPVGRTTGSDGTAVGIGAPGRMTIGIVANGRADAIGTGPMLGVETVFGIGSVFGSAAEVGSGIRLGTGSTSGRTVITGNASGDATAGSVGTGGRFGATVAAARGVGAAVQATDAISAITTTRRIPQISPPPDGQVTGQPTVLECNQVAAAVQSASEGLTGLEASP
jgi:hypothetical protein